jgi:hypothetical protein
MVKGTIMRDLPRYHRTVPAAHRRRLGAMSAMALLIAVAGILPASADRIDLEQRVLFGEEGSVVEVAVERVEPDQVGASCTMRVHTENQESVHPGNDLVITTGDSQAVIEDVEAVADAGRDLSAPVVLGETIVVELRFGPDRLSSMGYVLAVDCSTTGPILADDGCDRSTTDATTETTADATGGAAVGDGCGGSTAPINEVSVPTTTIPDDLCGDGGSSDGALTIDADSCTEPTVLDAQETRSPADGTTSGPGDGSTATTAPASTSTPTGSSGDDGPQVLGIQVEALPQSPAAEAVTAVPAYTG